MKVLLVSSGSGSRGGGEIFLDYLGKGLTDRGHEVIVWMPKHPRMDELAAKCARFSQVVRSDYCNTYDYRARSLATSFNWAVSRRIANEWIRLRPDVIHINKQNLEDGLDLLRAVRNSALPSVCTIHLTQTAAYLRARSAGLRDWIAYRHLSRYRGTVIAVQERRREMLNDFLHGRARTKTVFNGVPAVDLAAMRSLRETTRRELGMSYRNVLVIGVGRLVEQKQPFRFLQVAKELHARIPDTKFLWIGDGKLARKWCDLVLREGLQDVVSCAGWQPNVQPYLHAGDLLLHTAEFEGLPFVMIEAMAAKLACAVTRDLASEIPLLNERNTLFVDDIDELAAKVRDPDIVAKIAEAGRRLFEDRFSVETMAEAYERLYVDALRNPKI